MNTATAAKLFFVGLSCISLLQFPISAAAEAGADKIDKRAKMHKKMHKKSKKKGDKKKKTKLKVSGTLMLDLDNYGEFYDESADSSTLETEIRRAQIALRYKSKDGWRGKLKLAFDDKKNEVDVNDAYLKYTRWSWATLTVGKFKEPFGLERLNASSRTFLIERAMISNALAPGRSYGIMLGDTKKRYNWALGFFQEDDDDKYNEERPTALTGRISYAPVHNIRDTLHIGIAHSYRDWNQNKFQIKDDGEVHSAENMIFGTEFEFDKESKSGFELIARYRSLSLQSEYIKTKIEEVEGPNWEYQGYYVQASYILTGESRQYKRGKLSSVQPRTDKGAWEIVARYSELDLRDNSLGAKAAINTIGVNYYLSKQTRFMLNYLDPDIEGNTFQLETSGEAISLRLQHLFRP